MSNDKLIGQINAFYKLAMEDEAPDTIRDFSHLTENDLPKEYDLGIILPTRNHHLHYLGGGQEGDLWQTFQKKKKDKGGGGAWKSKVCSTAGEAIFEAIQHANALRMRPSSLHNPELRLKKELGSEIAFPLPEKHKKIKD
jgi:hypothetical protein